MAKEDVHAVIHALASESYSSIPERDLPPNLLPLQSTQTERSDEANQLIERLESGAVDYPYWRFFPDTTPPPEWVEPLIEAVRKIPRHVIDSRQTKLVQDMPKARQSEVEQRLAFHEKARPDRLPLADKVEFGLQLTSNDYLEVLRYPLHRVGFDVEGTDSNGNPTNDKLFVPVAFGSHGRATVSYEIDALHSTQRVLVEIEAGRGAQSNAFDRDLLRAFLAPTADYLVLVCMLRYLYRQSGRTIPNWSITGALEKAALAMSGRLPGSLDGILIVGL